jgi:hypothetical protein
MYKYYKNSKIWVGAYAPTPLHLGPPLDMDYNWEKWHTLLNCFVIRVSHELQHELQVKFIHITWLLVTAIFS